jgi:MFS family permease
MDAPSAALSAKDDEAAFPFWRRNRWATSCSAFLCSLGLSLSMPFVPLMMQAMGVTEHLEAWSGNTLLLFYLAGFVFNPIWGGLADHYGRKLMLLRATLGMGACMALIPLGWSPLSFAAIFIFAGIFNGSMSATSALILGNTPSSRVGGTLAQLQTANVLGRTLGPAVAVVVAALISGINLMFLLSGLLWLAGGLVVLVLVQEVKQPRSGAWRPDWLGDLTLLLRIPRMPALLALGCVTSVLSAGNVTILSIHVIHLFELNPPSFGSKEFWVGAVAMALAVSNLLALPFFGRILDRHGPQKLLVFTTAAAALTHLPLLFVDTPMGLVLARVAFGLTSPAMQPAVMWLMRIHAPRGMDARAISYSTSFQFVAIGLAPFVAGLVGPVTGLRSYFGLVIVLTLFSLLYWFRSDARARASAG